jgi:hypothetical protein
MREETLTVLLLVRRWSTATLVRLPRLVVPADAPKPVSLPTMITVSKENAVMSTPLRIDLDTPTVCAVSVAIGPVKIAKPRPRLSRLDSDGALEEGPLSFLSSYGRSES